MQNSPLSVRVFLLTLFIPAELSIDLLGLRFSAYRFMLIFLFLPVVARYSSLKYKHKHRADKFVVLFSSWLVLSMMVNHGFESGLKSGGIMALETMLPYFIARTYITSKDILLSTLKFYISCISVVALFAVYEAYSGSNLFKQLFGIFPQVGEQRLGLYRASVAFDHPILLAVMSAVSLPMWMAVYGEKKEYLRLGTLVVSALSSLSSIAFMVVAMQFFVYYYKKLLLISYKKYIKFLVVFYVAVDLVANRKPLEILLSHLTLDPQTGYFRILIWRYGLDSVYNNFLFGIGYHEWVRLGDMPMSVDSIWLLLAMRHGVPVIFFISVILYYALKRNKSKENVLLDKYLTLSVMVLLLAGFTVHYWNATYVFLFFLLGLNINLFSYDQKPNSSIKST